MSLRVTDALAAYAQAAGQAGSAGVPAGGEGFADMLRGLAGEAVKTGQRADRLTAAATEGKANITELVTAVAEAELTLQTVVAVRDRIVHAYQEILRMPI